MQAIKKLNCRKMTSRKMTSRKMTSMVHCLLENRGLAVTFHEMVTCCQETTCRPMILLQLTQSCYLTKWVVISKVTCWLLVLFGHMHFHATVFLGRWQATVLQRTFSKRRCGPGHAFFKMGPLHLCHALMRHILKILGERDGTYDSNLPVALEKKSISDDSM